MTDAVVYVLPFGPLGRLARLLTERFGATVPSVITPDEPMEISR